MSVIYTEGVTPGDWLKARPFDAGFDSQIVEIKSADDLASGTVLGKNSTTGIYTKCNTAASDGTQTALGILIDPVKATGVYATKVTGTPATNSIQWKAKELGAAGNDITIALVDPAGNNASLSVAVTGSINSGWAVVVNLATNGSSVITSTPALIVAAVAANAAAAAIIVGTADGASAVAAVAATALTGGVGYDITNQGVMLAKLTGTVIYFSKLAYSGTAGTVQTALINLGATMAIETD